MHAAFNVRYHLLLPSVSSIFSGSDYFFALLSAMDADYTNIAQAQTHYFGLLWICCILIA